MSPDVISVLIANEYKATSEKADNSNNLPLHYAYEIDYMVSNCFVEFVICSLF